MFRQFKSLLFKSIFVVMLCFIAGCSYGKNSLEQQTERAYELFKNDQYNECIELCDNILNADK